MERLAAVRASGVRFAAPLCAFEFHQSGVAKRHAGDYHLARNRSKWDTNGAERGLCDRLLVGRVWEWGRPARMRAKRPAFPQRCRPDASVAMGGSQWRQGAALTR